MGGVPWLLMAERLELSDTLLGEFYKVWEWFMDSHYYHIWTYNPRFYSSNKVWEWFMGYLHDASAKVDELQRNLEGHQDNAMVDELEDDADDEGSRDVNPEEVATAEAIDKLKFISEMGLMKIATQKVEHEQREAKRATGVDVSKGRWSMDAYSPGDAKSGDRDNDLLDRVREKQRQKVEKMVKAGARELGGEIEALRGHYAALVMADNWDPQVHEDVALGLDAVAEAARMLQVPAIEEDARNVSQGVRQMADKVAHLGGALL